jgi:hypothetical protein
MEARRGSVQDALENRDGSTQSHSRTGGNNQSAVREGLPISVLAAILDGRLAVQNKKLHSDLVR